MDDFTAQQKKCILKLTSREKIEMNNKVDFTKEDWMKFMLKSTLPSREKVEMHSKVEFTRVDRNEN